MSFGEKNFGKGSSEAFSTILKEKIGIAPEDFENHENSSNFILGYLSEFLLK